MSGRRVLVVEHDAFLADDMAQALQKLGAATGYDQSCAGRLPEYAPLVETV